jgi:hypothetical protein
MKRISVQLPRPRLSKWLNLQNLMRMMGFLLVRERKLVGLELKMRRCPVLSRKLLPL